MIKYCLAVLFVVQICSAWHLPEQDIHTKAACGISINNGLPDPQPLILKIGGSNDGFGFHLPEDATGIVNIQEGEDIRIVCAGSTNYFVPLGSGIKDVTATCVGGTSFLVDGTTYTFSSLYCNSNPFHTARLSGDTCYNGAGVMIEIGFEVGVDEFFKTLDICFDDTLKNSHWSKFDCVSGIGGYQSGFPRPGFIADNFYPGLAVDNLYSRITQRQTISTTLRSTALGNFYIHDSDDYFLARGHLSAKADFVYGSQHRATFHFVNVAPQWQTFNGANWNVLEQNVRSFADARKLNLVVYTGTHGVMTLPDVDDVQQEIYLSVDVNNNVALPVPRLYWKVVYNPLTEEAIAFLGVNNPYVENPSSDSTYSICTNVCDQVSWLTWDETSIVKGYSYCCQVDDEFRSQVDTLPDFVVSGLLTK